MIQAIAILCLAVYGALISLIVGMKLEFGKKYNVSDSKTGLLFSGFMLAGAIGVIFLSSMIDVLGYRTVTIFGFCFTSVALLILAMTKSYRSTLAMYIILSIGAMCIISTGNTILPQVLFGGENESAATNLGNAFYGVGAFWVSYTLTGALRKFGQKATISFFAVIVMAVAVLSIFAEFPVNESTFSFKDLPAVLTNPIFILALAANFFGAGVENGVNSWANTYMSRLGADDQTANRSLSVFFVAVLVSRLIAATFVTPENTPLVLLGIAIISVAVLTVMIITSSHKVGLVCVGLMGMLMGSVCPDIFGYMFSHTDPAYHGTAFGILFATGLAGASVISALVGAMTRKRSFKFGFIVNIAGSVLLAACAIIATLI